MNYASASQPKSGVTLRIWELSSEITREKGRLALRRELINRAREEGIKESTASTQYHHWKTAQSDQTTVSIAVSPVRLVIGPDGRVVIPADMRRAMELDESGSVLAQIDQGALTLTSPTVGLRKAQELVRSFDKGDGSAAEELIQERRAEAARE